LSSAAAADNATLPQCDAHFRVPRGSKNPLQSPFKVQKPKAEEMALMAFNKHGTNNIFRQQGRGCRSL